MMHDIDTPRHTQGAILPVVGVTAGRIQNWVNRHLVKLSEQNPGVGNHRLYSDLDVIRLVTMVELTRVGVTPAIAADFATKVVEPRARAKATEPNYRQESKAQKAIFFYEDGEMKYIVAEQTDQWMDLSRVSSSMKCRVEISVYIERICEQVWEYFDQRQAA